VFPAADSHKLQELRFSIPLDIPDREYARAAHRAGPDAYVNAFLVVDLIKRGTSISDLVAWTSSPSPFTRLPFGKHKGKPISEVPIDYLKWLIGTNPDKDIAYTVKNEIAARNRRRTA
jgi:exodeoxyribonuclease X